MVIGAAVRRRVGLALGRVGFLNNVRRGFATNSSSSHSFVFFNEMRGGHDSLAINEPEAPDFGRRRYTLTTLGEKLLYAMIHAFSQVEVRDAGDAAIVAARRQFGHLFPEFEQRDDIWQMAATGTVYDQWTRVTPAFMEAVRDPKVEIWGDSDSSERLDELTAYPEDDASTEEWIAFDRRKDREGDLPNEAGRELGIVKSISVWQLDQPEGEVADDDQSPA